MRLPDIRCRACGDSRPFDIIQVKKVDTSLPDFPVGTFTSNYQYCGDRSACVEKAEAFQGYNVSPKEKRP